VGFLLVMDDFIELTGTESARAARRDRRASAKDRAAMNNGGAKHFKVIGEVVARRGRAADQLLKQHRAEKEARREQL
jgi:hypothetical protein